MLNICRAEAIDSEILTNLAIESEAYWGCNFESLGIEEFVLVISPQAKEFYTKLGANLCGEVESLVVKGRMIPKLIYTFK